MFYPMLPLSNINSTAAIDRPFQPAASFPSQTAASLPCMWAFSNTLELAGLHLLWQSSNMGRQELADKCPSFPILWWDDAEECATQFSVFPSTTEPQLPTMATCLSMHPSRPHSPRCSLVFLETISLVNYLYPSPWIRVCFWENPN